MPDAIKDAELDWVSLHEATKLLGVNREAALRLGLENKLVVQKTGGRWTIVSRASIDRYLAEQNT